jgi:RNA polymerase sigma-70 factor (ECF subfamily)
MKDSLSTRGAQVIAQWLQEARNGSKEALAEAFSYCRRYLRQRLRCEIPRDLQAKFGDSDLAQAAFLEVQEAFTEFQGTTPKEFVAWLFQILLHQASNFRRHYRGTKKRAVGRELSLETCKKDDRLREQLLIRAPAPDLTLARREEDEALHQALAKLPPRCREVVYLHGREDKSFPEIGMHLNLSDEAVRKIWVRSIAILKGQLTSYD